MTRIIAGILISMSVQLISACGSNSSDGQEKELLRKEAELAKKEADLAKKELELSKGSNSSNSANVTTPVVDTPKPVIPRRVKTPLRLNAITERNDKEVLAVDLNRDGQDEYIGVSEFGCGSGGCNLGVFQRTANGFKNILDEDDGSMMPDPAPPPYPRWKPDYRFQAGPDISNSYLDIVLVWNKGKSERFRFDGIKYRSAK